MFGVLLQLISSFVEECAETIGKDNVRKHLETALGMGFLNALFTTAIFIVTITFVRGWDAMTLNAWPTFLIRTALLILQAAATVQAIAITERSTFGFVRAGTMPLLLMIDVAMGVQVTGWQVVGMICIVGTILILMMNHGLSKKGMGLLLYTMASAAIQLSLYRYNITHGNSVELEQLLSTLAVGAGLYALVTREGANPFKLIRRPRPALQSGLNAVANLIGGYAFLYAPASVILSTGRAASVMAAVLAGHLYFKEKKFSQKLIAFVGCAIGIILLTFATP